MKSPEVIIAYLENQSSSTVGRTSRKMIENTGETMNMYPASRSLVNHTLLQTTTILGKTEKQRWE